MGLASFPGPILFLKQDSALLYGLRVMQKKSLFMLGNVQNRISASLCTLPSNPPNSEFLIVEQATFGFDINVSANCSQYKILLNVDCFFIR